jgi:hypothetical protein
MNRESGFYWVKIEVGNSTKWYICEYDKISKVWNFKGCAYPDDSFLQIDERKIERLKD